MESSRIKTVVGLAAMLWNAGCNEGDEVSFAGRAGGQTGDGVDESVLIAFAADSQLTSVALEKLDHAHECDSLVAVHERMVADQPRSENGSLRCESRIELASAI